MHATSDALFAGVYPLLPLVAADLNLSYGEVGAVKALLGASSALLQVPAGMLAEVLGEHFLLAAGTAWVGLGLAAMALVASFLPLLALAFVAGIGGNTQHPVANAAVARLYDDAERPGAIGILNFAGDVGKVIAPFVGGFGAALAGWRGGFTALGVLGAAFAVAYAIVVPVRWNVRRAEVDGGTPSQSPAGAAEESSGPIPGVPSSSGYSPPVPPPRWRATGIRWHPAAWGVASPVPYAVLCTIGALDAGARGAALALMPFAFARAGMDAAQVGVAFAVLFGAGAAGKFLCGPLASRAGLAVTIIVTEVVTAIGIVVIPVAPREAILWSILPFGFALNGTSSVLYALVAPLAVPAQRARAYGLYYTVTLLATAGSPVLYGTVADVTGLGAAFVALGGVTLVIVPLAWAWRSAFGSSPVHVTVAR
jgi:MFS family permease